MYMPEEIYKKFEKRKAEILQEPETKEKELTLEKQKEILKETVLEQISKVQPVSDGQQKATDQSAKQVQAEPREKQIKLLTDLAFEKGVVHAIEVAKRLDNPYLLDEFHDALVDELYNKLIETGKLKAI